MKAKIISNARRINFANKKKNQLITNFLLQPPYMTKYDKIRYVYKPRKNPFWPKIQSQE